MQRTQSVLVDTLGARCAFKNAFHHGVHPLHEFERGRVIGFDGLCSITMKTHIPVCSKI
jgi:hypothetical protein